MAESGAKKHNQIYEVPIDNLTSMKDQPRGFFDEESLENLKQNIMRNGIVNPLLITKDNQIVSGERRYRAAKMAGLSKIPAIYKEDNIYEIAVVDNIMREDLTAVEKAEGLKRLFDQVSAEDSGLTQEKFGEYYKFKKATISEYFSVANTDKKIRDMFREQPDAAFRRLKEIAAIKDKVKRIEAAKEYQKSLAKTKRQRSTKSQAATKKIDTFINDIKKLPKSWANSDVWSDQDKKLHMDKLKQLRAELDSLISGMGPGL